MLTENDEIYITILGKLDPLTGQLDVYNYKLVVEAGIYLGMCCRLYCVEQGYIVLFEIASFIYEKVF